ncbi:WD40-repeat-containing domain protein [Mycena alexandri]|uniref:WD40-repeat-containing domain protein n=1 Tax=Mycena alexandri TaxID=1745969 RepID=A0AAD6X8Q0_9AGAR|nr:WD40-repeat-containing domain protein [Mycena alexandri]
MANPETPEFLVAEAQLVLGEARRQKSERTKNLGEPIQLPGKALAIQIHKGYAWVAENTTVARKMELQTGNTLQIYRGHTGPVTSVAFWDKDPLSGDGSILITGSWDKTIKLWDTDTKALISSTDAHSDFVKCLFVIPSLRLLVSGSSDKIVRFWDLSDAMSGKPLTSVGSISAHTRPISCIDGVSLSDTSAVLYTADSMGAIKTWDLVKEGGEAPRWKSTLKSEMNHHRTGVNEMRFGRGQLWTASSDDTAQILADPTSTGKPPVSITHPTAVRCILPLSVTDLAEPYLITGAGDVIRVYDVSSIQEPELINEIDAHWYDVTALHLWIRKTPGADGKTRVEPWVVSTSLDGTIRKWRLAELLTPSPPSRPEPPKVAKPAPATKADSKFEMTEEEERELAELLDD